jgi:flavin-dependent dehydrogenase
MQEIWDVVVVGGGPAGLMAAGTAAKSGKNLKVLLLEKNDSLGKKLLIKHHQRRIRPAHPALKVQRERQISFFGLFAV